MVNGERSDERLFFLVTGVAAGCSTLTRNAVTHGLDPEVRKCLKIGNSIKEFLKLFCCRFVAHCAVLHYRL